MSPESLLKVYIVEKRLACIYRSANGFNQSGKRRQLRTSGRHKRVCDACRQSAGTPAQLSTIFRVARGGSFIAYDVRLGRGARASQRDVCL